MDWNLVGMLHVMSVTAKGVVVMLFLMSAISIGLAVERGLRYSVAPRFDLSARKKRFLVRSE
jgi:hypothetical protein